MRNNLKKTVIAAAVAAAAVYGSGAWAGAVLFDTSGQGGIDASKVVSLDTFVWNPGNIVVTNTIPVTDALDEVFMYMQSNLAGFTINGNNTNPNTVSRPGGGTLTFQTRSSASATVGSTADIEFSNNTTANTFFDIFFTAGAQNNITGCGYGTHETGTCTGTNVYESVLSGSVELITASWSITNPLVPGVTCVTGAATPAASCLDQNTTGAPSGENQAGVRSVTKGDISGDYKINITSFSPLWFLTPVGSMISSFDTTLNAAGNVPFTNAGGTNPSNQVAGRQTGDSAVLLDTTYGTDRIMDNTCGGVVNHPQDATDGVLGGGVCDIHAFVKVTNSFDATYVPEPASVALLGLGLGAMGLGFRRRRAKAAA